MDCLRVTILLAVAACSAPATPATRPIANATTPEPKPLAARCTLDWIDTARELRITEVSDGHFGMLELHADLVRWHDNDYFDGVITATYRDRPERPPQSTAKNVRFALATVVGAVAAMRDGMAIPETPFVQNLVVLDSSQTRTMSIVIGDRRENKYGELFTDDGHVSPQRWSIRGCERSLSHQANVAVTAAYAKLEAQLGRDDLLAALVAKVKP